MKTCRNRVLIMLTHTKRQVDVLINVVCSSHSAKGMEKVNTITQQIQLHHCPLTATNLYRTVAFIIVYHNLSFLISPHLEFTNSTYDCKYTDLKLMYYYSYQCLTLLIKNSDLFSDGAVRWGQCVPFKHTCATGYNGGCGLLCFWWVYCNSDYFFSFFIPQKTNKELITLSMSFLLLLLKLKWVTAWSKIAHCEALQACLLLSFWLCYKINSTSTDTKYR